MRNRTLGKLIVALMFLVFSLDSESATVIQNCSIYIAPSQQVLGKMRPNARVDTIESENGFTKVLLRCRVYSHVLVPLADGDGLARIKIDCRALSIDSRESVGELYSDVTVRTGIERGDMTFVEISGWIESDKINTNLNNTDLDNATERIYESALVNYANLKSTERSCVVLGVAMITISTLALIGASHAKIISDFRDDFEDANIDTETIDRFENTRRTYLWAAGASGLGAIASIALAVDAHRKARRIRPFLIASNHRSFGLEGGIAIQF